MFSGGEVSRGVFSAGEVSGGVFAGEVSRGCSLLEGGSLQGVYLLGR